MCLTIAYFNLLGKTLVLRTALQVYVNGEIINGALHFMIRLQISSYPHVFLVLNDLMIFFDFLSRGILPTHFCEGSSKTVW